VPSAAFERHSCPVHCFRELSAPRVADCAGVSVKHIACVSEFWPNWLSISHSKLPDGA